MRIKNILQYLESTAERIPEHPAFCDEDAALSFAALRERARRGGSEILRRGLRGEAVAVFMRKSPDMLCAFFAAVYAGCYYVPVDAGMPPGRIRGILKQTRPRLIVSDGSGSASLEALGWADRTIGAAELFSAPEDPAALARVRAAALDIDPVYVIFTSGSTGAPKGVVCCHRSIIDYAEAICPVIGADENSVFAIQTPLFVDACLKEILSVLRNGASAWLMPQNLFMNPLAAIGYLNRHRVNSIIWVASALTMLSGLGAFEDAAPEHLKLICTQSEVLPVRQLHLWQAAAPGARFLNFYGPTECTGASFYYEVDRDFSEDEALPVGRPFDNTGFLLLGEDGSEVPPGETGEICLRGTNVSLGYYADPERSAAAFPPNPRNSLWRETIYRTGDLGYLNPRGELMFLGRRDNQIKNMGHRVELGEIEAAAASVEGIESACCLWDPERRKLILYYMGSAAEAQARAALRSLLPRHMLPGRIYRLDALPLLLNGKVDRQSLYKAYQEGGKP
ncbi:MAG: amino acid adenylation domain-containing protein [Oscillospiraceae bacterium]|nr:amino acid adenylation domain-containing protein [Oscillospiraceae bacterium]